MPLHFLRRLTGRDRTRTANRQLGCALAFVAGGINAARHNARTDMCVGIGGSPEGIVTACAIKALGGHIQGRLWPRSDEERQRGIDAGLKLDDHVYEADDLVKGNNTIFVATGVTDGALVAGVRREGGYVYTESVVLRLPRPTTVADIVHALEAVRFEVDAPMVVRL